jgi:hypothetical protein
MHGRAAFEVGVDHDHELVARARAAVGPFMKEIREVARGHFGEILRAQFDRVKRCRALLRGR